MKKDDRLYARFDIGMDEHPKIMLLSDAAFRALMEATFYARRQMTDGFLDERVAVRKWGREVIDELASNHEERPTLERVDGGWKIRDYEEHQVTREDIERKREAGRAGGLAKAKHNASKPVARASNPQTESVGTGLANGYESLAKKETEKELEKEKEKIKPSSAPAARASMFDAAYESWPKKVDRKDAAEKWPRAVKAFGGTEADLVVVVKAHADAYRAHSSKQFTPALVVWLNKERWNNELPTASESRDRQPAVNRNLSVVDHFRQAEQLGISA